ncbi:MAG: XdhC family protein [Pseudomonadota bacterium]|nr:XdhC family protein [Pseudomonadota bacterium]
MSQRFLINKFNEWRRRKEPLALVTVVATEGSTYSKAGRHILIRSTGEHVGLVSGGCLEGDLAEHAENSINTGDSQLITYDMRDDADQIWGMGVGCNGLIEVLVQKLSYEENWEPFKTLANAIASPKVSIASMVIESEDPKIPVGSLGILDSNNKFISGKELPAPTKHLPCISNINSKKILSWQIDPWPRLLLLGGGPDAEPVCNMAINLGWKVTVVDHRATLIQSNGFINADEKVLLEPNELSLKIKLEEFSACVVMSHHLETDLVYLQQLAKSFSATDFKYIGVLGPSERRLKLLDQLTDIPSNFTKFLRGPVGLDIGAKSPETIALSLLGEIQAVHAQRSGGPITSTNI